MKLKTNWPKFINWYIINPKLSGLIVFIFLGIIFSLLASKQYVSNIEFKRLEKINTLETIHQNIEQSLKNSYITALTLALTINDEGNPENFEGIGQKLLKSNAAISAVQLVPQGIIKYTYPLKGNEAAMNLNIFKANHTKIDALKSMKYDRMYFSGPLNLKQGGKAIIGRLPVYIKQKFWGFSAVIIKFDKFLDAASVNSINNNKYEFQLAKKNTATGKTDFFLKQTTQLTNGNFVKKSIPDGNWDIYIIDKKANHLLISYITNTILGLLLALVFGVLTVLLLKKSTQLQVLVNKQALSLKDNEIKFKTIFDQASVGIANVELKSGKLIEVNNYFCKMLGYTEKEMKLKTFQSITHPDDLIEDVRNAKNLNEGKIDEYSMEKRYFSKQGKIVWGNLSVTPLLNQNKKQISVIGIVENITIKKENEELIAKNENHFKSLFYDSPIPLREEDFSEVKKALIKLKLINRDPEEVKKFLHSNPKITNELHLLIKSINVNKACLELFKVENEEELSNVKNNLFNSKSFDDFVDQIVAICQEKTSLILDTVIQDSKNYNRNINLRWNVIRGYEKTLERVIVYNEDITERKDADKIIRNSQEKIQSLIDTVDGIVWECNPETFEFTFVSKKVEEILGYSAEEWLSSPTFWSDHIYVEDKESIIDFCQFKTEQKEDHDFEYRMVAKDNKIVWLRDIVTVVCENNKIINLRGIMIDITKTKEVEKHLKDSFNLVSEQNKRLLNFSYIVSHNLRSHTSNITSLTDLIQCSETAEEKDELIDLLKLVSNALNDTLYNLNEVVNIQTNLNLVVEKLKLKPYLDNTLTILRNEIRANKITVNSNITEKTEIHYNPAYLESILYNMISNAVRYCDKNRECEVDIVYSCEDGKSYLSISDNGIGIDLKRNGDKIFGMYKTFTDNVDSKGIGLFITKNQIEAMGGSVTIDSTLGKGTTFKIQLT
ncbi:PAS domain S-box protein [Flavobacterium frigidarium]|uniref:PAS domain S-box protein n=1 Tax=Flavobacterium frigidarium TaxID=99286 RepID=UPI0030D7EA8C